MPVSETLFSLVADAGNKRVSAASERNELLLPDWRDTILRVHAGLCDQALPADRDALLRLIDQVVDAQIARECAAFRIRYAAQLAGAPPPSEDVVALLCADEPAAAVDLYRRHMGLGYLITRDALAQYAEERLIPIPPGWTERKVVSE